MTQAIQHSRWCDVIGHGQPPSGYPTRERLDELAMQVNDGELVSALQCAEPGTQNARDLIVLVRAYIAGVAAGRAEVGLKYQTR